MQRLKSDHQLEGFTFVEVSLAFLFLALISITVALVINSVTSIYNKGLSIKAINSTGSDLIEEFSTNLAAAPATQLTAICEATFPHSTTATSAYQKCLNGDAANREGAAYKFIFTEHRDNVRLIDEAASAAKNVQTSGAFCTGKYSYVWNTGYLNNPLYTKKDDTSNAQISGYTLTYRVTGESTDKTFPAGWRLLRIEDPSRVACASQLKDYGAATNASDPLASNTYEAGTGTTYNLTKDSTGSLYTIASDPVELILANENPLAVYNFYVASPSQDSTTNRLFYAGSFVLATLRGGVNLTTISDYCQLSGAAEDFDYCAINKFNFAAEATGK